MNPSITVRDARGDRAYRVEDFPLTVGGRAADIALAGVAGDESLATLALANGMPFIQVEPDSQAVFLNGQRLQAVQWLRHEDVVRVGDAYLRCDITPERIHFEISDSHIERNTLPPLEVSETFMGEPPRPVGEDSAETIQPLAFKPAAAQPQRSAKWTKPLPALLLVVFGLLGLAAWFMVSARPVQFNFDPSPDRIAVRGALLTFQLGGRHLLRPGTYTVEAEKHGYRSLRRPIEVTHDQDQAFTFTLEKLPGRLAVVTRPGDGAQVIIDGEQAGQTPLAPMELKPGEHEIIVRADRYLEYRRRLVIQGGGAEQNLEIELAPAWAAITVHSVPTGARVWVDGEAIGITPLTAELLQGERELQIKAPGYKTWQQRLEVVANEPQTLADVALEKADSVVAVRTRPAGANVTVDGRYRGQTPLELNLPPGKTYRIALSKAGYRSVTRKFQVDPGTEQDLSVKLKANKGVIRIVSQPKDAELYVDGVRSGTANRRLELTAIPHRLEIKKTGFAPHTTTITPRPGFEQELSVKLKTLAQAKAIPTKIKTRAGQQLRLVRPGRFTMGASRREQGRRANEVQYPVKLTRAFYIAAKEVTNEEFRAFAANHYSGIVQNTSLEQDGRPVVRITWEQAAHYCNWLSDKEGLEPVYVEKGGKLVARQPLPMGYRLPTEAEWAWAARYAGGSKPSKYPWGTAMPPPGKSGNYADESATTLLQHTLTAYDDGHAATAPVGTYAPNPLGLFDLGGNVAEWLHDYYSFGPEDPSKLAVDPSGPAEGRYHVVRGSSWMHASISELRLTYRDYGDKARPDLGFRIARYAD